MGTPNRGSGNKSGRFMMRLSGGNIPKKGQPLIIDTDGPGWYTYEALQAETAFKKDGTVTAGNASGKRLCSGTLASRKGR